MTFGGRGPSEAPRDALQTSASASPFRLRSGLYLPVPLSLCLYHSRLFMNHPFLGLPKGPGTRKATSA